jgi:hypothetical protein
MPQPASGIRSLSARRAVVGSRQIQPGAAMRPSNTALGLAISAALTAPFLAGTSHPRANAQEWIALTSAQRAEIAAKLESSKNCRYFETQVEARDVLGPKVDSKDIDEAIQCHREQDASRTSLSSNADHVLAGVQDCLPTGGSRFREEASSPGSDEIRATFHEIISGALRRNLRGEASNSGTTSFSPCDSKHLKHEGSTIIASILRARRY